MSRIEDFLNTDKPNALDAHPALDPRDRGGPLQPLLKVEGLTKHFVLKNSPFDRKRQVVRAVDGIDFSIAKGETLGIVGESGCGKSTTARLLMHLVKPDAGTTIFDGDPVGGAQGVSIAEMRRQVQMVFQDSYASLNPRMPLADGISFGPRANGVRRAEARERAHELLNLVGLAPERFAQRYPHEISGGQRQRVNIARALAMHPRLVILDEAVSALDKSVEAQTLNLLIALRARLNLTYVFISHDLNVVQFISDRVLVMYLGKVVEIGPVDRLYAAPAHPYTAALLASRPSMDPRRRVTKPPLQGDPPNPINPPSGCRFRTRCPIASAVCAEREPPLLPLELRGEHAVACHARVPGTGHVYPAHAA